jgi:hypothetical protein
MALVSTSVAVIIAGKAAVSIAATTVAAAGR